MSYKLAILKRKSIIKSAVTFYRMVRCMLLKKYKYFFYRKTKCDDAVIDPDIRYTVYKTSDDLESVKEAYANAGKIVPSYDDALKLLSKGRVLILGFNGDEIVGVSWFVLAVHFEDKFFPMTDDSAFIFRCAVKESCRGKNIYSNMLNWILGHLSSQKIENAFISCWDFNYPSQKGIERSGFKFIGRAKFGLRNSKVWYQEEQPDISD